MAERILDMENLHVSFDTYAGEVKAVRGLFIQNIVNFILTAFCMFLVIRAMNKVYKKPEPAPEKPKRICPFCKSEIADDATRCPHCTSMLE